MKKIVLVHSMCSRGAFAAMVAEKIQEVAISENYPCEVAALSLSEIYELRKIDADIILLEPLCFHSSKKIQEICPNTPIDILGMKAYGLMDGKTILNFAKKKMQVIL